MCQSLEIIGNYKQKHRFQPIVSTLVSISSPRPILAIFVHYRVAECYEYAMLPEHMNSPDPTVGVNSITETGALCISSGSKAGRVPKQKRIVEDDITRDVRNQLIRNSRRNFSLTSLYL